MAKGHSQIENFICPIFDPRQDKFFLLTQLCYMRVCNSMPKHVCFGNGTKLESLSYYTFIIRPNEYLKHYQKSHDVNFTLITFLKIIWY